MVSMSNPKNIGKMTDLLTLVSSVLTFDRFLRVKRHRGSSRLAPWTLGAMTKLVILPLPSDTPVSPTGLAIADRPGTRYRALHASTGSFEGNSEFCGKRLGPVSTPQNRKSPI